MAKLRQQYILILTFLNLKHSERFVMVKLWLQLTKEEEYDEKGHMNDLIIYNSYYFLCYSITSILGIHM